VLLGHTREDQAETVLLRLARGSGAASLAAMRSVNGAYRRPFLDLPRSVVRAAADRALAPLGVHPWQDPHNDDTAYARVRVRSALAILVDALGDGVVAGLARSADLLAADADALDAVADAAFADLVEMGGDTVSVDCGHLAAVARAVRTRIVRAMAVTAGVPRDRLTRDHVIAVCALVEDWRGQGAVSLPGAVVARRAYGRLWLAAAPSDGGHERTDDVDG
jgi:tRNA(Ile)-lysidine synthase